MRNIVAAALLLLAAGAAPTAAQPAWTTTELGGGSAQFQLTNEDGASLILMCELRGVNGGFEFPAPVDPAERATLRAVPGERQNVAVTPINDRLFQVTGGRGIDTFLRLLRTTASLRVSLSGERAAFRVFGSDSIVSECLQRQEPQPGGSASSSIRGGWASPAGFRYQDPLHLVNPVTP